MICKCDFWRVNPDGSIDYHFQEKKRNPVTGVDEWVELEGSSFASILEARERVLAHDKNHSLCIDLNIADWLAKQANQNNPNPNANFLGTEFRFILTETNPIRRVGGGG